MMTVTMIETEGMIKFLFFIFFMFFLFLCKINIITEFRSNKIK